MKMFIAEKPSVAKIIAENLEGKVEKKDGYFKVGENIVAALHGHIMRTKNPDEIDEKYKKWNMENLPIIPQTWEKVVTDKKTFAKIKTLIKELKPLDVIVNAGDADREGQLLVDEVLEAVKNTIPVQRIWMLDNSKKGMQRALENLKDNNDYIGLKNSATARMQLDWLTGMNYSRFFTLAARAEGLEDVFHVGRVKTPTLAIIVRREKDIKNFIQKKYYELVGYFKGASGDLKLITAKWQSKKESIGLDEEHQMIDVIALRDLMVKIELEKNGIVSAFSKEQKSESQKGMYSLSKLQIEAGQKYKLDPKEVLDICQSLYEKKLTTYPRSDCEYLPESQHTDAEEILHNLLLTGDEELKKWALSADFKIKSAAFNDKKVSAHTAIIPTSEICDLNKLPEKEAKIYKLIGKNYLTQFYPVCIFDATKIEITIAGEVFATSGKMIVDAGWKVLYQTEKENSEENADEDEKELPVLKQDEAVNLIKLVKQEKVTKPKKRFTTATLIGAMKNVGPYCKSQEYKKILKDTIGIGTEATRSTIIEELLTKNYMIKEKGNLVPTAKAFNLIKICPENITYPDFTGHIETELKDVQEKKGDMQKILLEQIDEIKAVLTQKVELENTEKIICPVCKNGALKRRKGKNGYFWGCSNYPACKTTFSDKDGKPDTAAKKTTSNMAQIECPICHKGHLVQYSKKENKEIKFWSCSQWREGCKAFFADYNNKPVIEICPICKQGYLKKNDGKKGAFWSCSNYPTCKTTFSDNTGQPKI